MTTRQATRSAIALIIAGLLVLLAGAAAPGRGTRLAAAGAAGYALAFDGQRDYLRVVDVGNFDFATTLEECLIAATCRYSQCRHVAMVSPLPPGRAWQRIAKHYKKTLVHIPLTQFSDSTVQQLRMVHVLNGKDVRSYAAEFIRRA